MQMSDEYAQRRQRALEAIHPGVLVVPSAPVAIRNNDVEHDYRQDSDLFYLTGFDEQDSLLVLDSTGEQKATLFVRPRDPEREVWDGARAGVEGAVAEFGVDAAFRIDEIAEQLPKLLENHDELYYRIGRDAERDAQVLAALERVRARAKQGVWWPTRFIDPATVLHEMRLVKSEAELELMRRAAEISAESHVAAMAHTRPGMYEYEVEAVMRTIWRKHGSERPAYGPIVGSGPNATVLHYRKNDRKMNDGELLLIDAACEYGYYAADITRTFPVGGSFSKPQREVYDVVLEAQLASIAATRAGATVEAVHDESVRVITEGLVRLGIVKGPVSAAIEEQRYKPYYMHRTSHYLGMDVHDVGTYFQRGKPRPLAAGTVITVEPGIYISAAAEVPEAYRGIGVRIEDDVLVGKDGRSVLTATVPKEASDVERACKA